MHRSSILSSSLYKSQKGVWSRLILVSKISTYKLARFFLVAYRSVVLDHVGLAQLGLVLSADRAIPNSAVDFHLPRVLVVLRVVLPVRSVADHVSSVFEHIGETKDSIIV